MLMRYGRAIGILGKASCLASLKGSSVVHSLQLVRTSQRADDFLRVPGRCGYATKASPPLRSSSLSLEPWTQEDCNRLLELKEAGLSQKEILAQFPGRTLSAIKSRYQLLRRALLPTESLKQFKPWNPEELKTRNALREKGLSWIQVAQQLPGRTVFAVKTAHLRNAKPHRRNAKLKRWTDDEVAQLQHLVEDLELSWAEVARRMPSRSLSALVTKYWALSESKQKTRFTAQESKLIFDLKSQGLSFAEIAEKFSGKSKDNVRDHWELKTYSQFDPDRKVYRKWTSSEDAELVKMREKGKKWSEIAGFFNVHWGSAHQRLAALGRKDLIKETNWKPSRKWTADEDAQLKSMRERGLTFAKMAESIGCSLWVVRARYLKLLGQEPAQSDAKAS